MSVHSTVQTAPVTELLKEYAAITDHYLDAWLKTLPYAPPRLLEAIRYSLMGPGKRIRPALAILSCQAVGGMIETALPAAAAVELIHCFSLVHDDLPAMDNDDLRRGRPTNHKVFGEALSILAGDAMNALAFELLAVRVSDTKMATALIRELALSTGPSGMIGGQVLDTCHPTEKTPLETPTASLEKLQLIHRMKTGALITAACRMGALAGGASEISLKMIDRLGQSIGLAFQIVDDLLDVTESDVQLGKRAGKDADLGKLTYPNLLGVEETRRHLAVQQDVAEKIIAQLGSDAQPLSELVRFMAGRRH